MVASGEPPFLTIVRTTSGALQVFASAMRCAAWVLTSVLAAASSSLTAIGVSFASLEEPGFSPNAKAATNAVSRAPPQMDGQGAETGLFFALLGRLRTSCPLSVARIAHENAAVNMPAKLPALGPELELIMPFSVSPRKLPPLPHMPTGRSDAVSINLHDPTCTCPQGHFTTGGIEERIESTLPPVLRPNTVPLS